MNILKLTLLEIVIICSSVASCSTFRTMEGKCKRTILLAKRSSFHVNDSCLLPETFSYKRFKGLNGNNVQLVDILEGGSQELFLHEPTIFSNNGADFMIYPGDKITVKDSGCTKVLATSDGNHQRDSELKVLQKFQQLEHWPGVQAGVQYTIDSIFVIEQRQRQRISHAEEVSQVLLDSLNKQYQTGKKFKQSTKGYVKHRYDLSLLWIYKLSKDTLLKFGIYHGKLRSLASSINSIKNIDEFNLNVRHIVNELLFEMFPKNMMESIRDLPMFKSCFDSVSSTFSGYARDYVLSRIMFRAYANGLKPPLDYILRYRMYNKNRAYRRLVTRMKKEVKRDALKTDISPDLLLELDGENTIAFAEVLGQDRNRYILIDLWASWCVPCLKEMPLLLEIAKKYPDSQIKFVSISIDKEVSAWRTKVYSRNLGSVNSFLLINSEHTALFKKFNVTTIPRYILMDAKGNIVVADMPSPSDAAFIPTLEKYIH